MCYPKVIGISLAFLILMSDSVTEGENPFHYALVDYIVSHFLFNYSVICKRKLAVIFREEAMMKKHWIGQSAWTHE
jgi:hypothetical protein